MFGILVSQHAVEGRASSLALDTAPSARHARRLTRMLARALAVIAWLPLVVLTLIKAV